MSIRGLLVSERNVLAISATELILSIGCCLWEPLLPLHLRQNLGASVPVIGAIYGPVAVPWMLSGLVGGYVSDRMGRKRVIVSCGLAAGASMLCYSLAATWLELLSFMLLQTAFSGAVRSTSRALVAESTDGERRGVAFSNVQLLSLGGQMIGPGLGGFLARALGFRPLFLVGGSLMLIGTLVRLLLLSERAGGGGARRPRPVGAARGPWPSTSPAWRCSVSPTTSWTTSSRCTPATSSAWGWSRSASSSRRGAR